MNTALLLDVDNTITPPRQPLTESMAKILERLNIPFYVVAGSHIGLLKEQFFEPLYKYGFRKRFDAFLGNGAIHYRCDYSKKMSIEVISSFNIRDYLGEIEYNSLIGVLTKTLELERFQLPPFLKVFGETITFRESMINFSPIGKPTIEDMEIQQNRTNFVEFDHSYKFRQKMMNYLKRELSSLISKRELTITLGGQTSFDIGIAGQDKTKPVRILLETGIKKLIFIGDALYEGGNDAVIREFTENWPTTSPCPVELIQVTSWKETEMKLFELGFLR